MATRLERRALVAVALLLALEAAVPAQADGGQASASTAVGLEVERAAAQVAAGEFREGRERLLALLEREGPASGELRQRAARIDGLLREAHFGLGYRRPSVRDLPAGEVLSFRERDARINLRYTPKSPQLDPDQGLPQAALARLVFGSGSSRDLPPFRPRDHVVVGEGRLAHEAAFGETVTLEVRGALPDHECTQVPRVWVCASESAWYEVTFTWPRYGIGEGIEVDQGKLARVAGGAREVLEVDRTVPSKYSFKIGRAYTARVLVEKDEIAVTVNGISGFRAPRDPAQRGLVAYAGFPGITAVELDGQVDRAWLDGLAARHLEGARARHVAEAPRDPLVPEWWAAFVQAAAGSGAGG